MVERVQEASLSVHSLAGSSGRLAGGALKIINGTSRNITKKKISNILPVVVPSVLPFRGERASFTGVRGMDRLMLQPVLRQ